MAKTKVVLNKRNFGALMVSPEIEAALKPYADGVAARVPSTEIEAVRTGVGTEKARVRLRVYGEIQDRAELIAALRAVVGRAKEV
jgi:hypothetical protein